MGRRQTVSAPDRMLSMSAAWRWVLALLPIFPPVYLSFFWFLRFWRTVSPLVQKVLMVFVISQLLAALLTPNPLLSFALSLLRAVFMVSLVLAGVQLRKSRFLHYLLIGYAVTFTAAFISSFYTSGGVFLLRRIMHPYYTTVSLGLSAVIALWILLDWRDGKWYLRLPLGALALAILAFSGSRGAVAALTVGIAAAALLRDRRYLWGLGAVAGLLGIAYAVLNSGTRVTAFSRFFSLRLSGRAEVWEGAIKAFDAHPWGGVGPYQLGPWLSTYYQKGCHLWKGAVRLGLSCPAWVERLNGAWLIAHNSFLQALGETGVVGTFGFAILLGFIGYAVVRSRNSLLAAIYFGVLAMSLVDNPMNVPSLHFAEVFWIAGGMALAQAGLAVPLEQGLAVDDDQLGPDPL